MQTKLSRPYRLVADISAHGFGHLAQTACVLEALYDSDPSIDIIIRTGHSPETVRKFVTVPYRLAEMHPDTGMVMTGPSHVDLEATRAAFIGQHNNLEKIVQAEAERLFVLGPDLLLSNIPYTSLLAAGSAHIPAVAFCSLNWYDILRGYAGDDPRMAQVLEEMRIAYRSTRQFILPLPSMPTDWHPALSHVGPLCRKAKDCPRPACLPASTEKAVVLVALGGIDGEYDPASLPSLPDVRWVVASSGNLPARNDMVSLEQTGLGLLDLMPHGDAIITKSGYGTFVEAACHGTRVLFAERPDWPEAAYLEPWLMDHATAASIPQDVFYKGAFASALRTLLEHPASPPVEATGAVMAARVILDHLNTL